MKTKLYFGMPGTGKTATLIADLLRTLDTEQPKDIAYVSFTRKAVQEASQRAFEATGIEQKKFPFFKTLHSSCFHACSMSRDDILKPSYLLELQKRIGIQLVHNDFRFDSVTIYNLARSRQIDPDVLWQKTMSLHYIPENQFKYVLQEYIKFKKENFLFDFTDILEEYLKIGTPIPAKTVFIDEAQDISKLQWQVISKLFANAEHMYIAGDDDQTIYQWAGADKNTMLTLDAQRVVLNQSHRFGENIAAYANNLTSNITKRYPKNLIGADKKDFVWHESYANPELINKRSWLMLARNHSILVKEAEKLRGHGITYRLAGATYQQEQRFKAMQAFVDIEKGLPILGSQAKKLHNIKKTRVDCFDDSGRYSCDDLYSTLPKFVDFFSRYSDKALGYYFKCYENKQPFAEPRVTLNTIHGSKGSEADNVILFSDQSRYTHKMAAKSPNSEHRIFYVGATRAKKRLVIINPATPYHYTL